MRSAESLFCFGSLAIRASRSGNGTPSLAATFGAWMTARTRPRALRVLLNIPRADAEAVDRAVQPWSASREGLVYASEGSILLLYVQTYSVEFLVDVAADTMHVERVRRGSP
jgi:hypothetical protein